MNTNSKKSQNVITLALLLCISVIGCSNTQGVSKNTTVNPIPVPTTPATTPPTESTIASTTSPTIGTAPNASELFSERDLKQWADLRGAMKIELQSGQNETLNDEGIYVLSGDVQNVTIIVEAAKDSKIQLVLDNVSIINEASPAIYVKEADKVFVTSTDSESHLEVTGTYTADGDTNLDAVIFSRADLTLNGTGNLTIISKEGNGISSKDDLKITGGIYTIHASLDGLEANDAILINDGTLTINVGKDALHSENSEDTDLGYIIIEGGTLTISAGEDGIQGNRFVQINGGSTHIEKSKEGIESTRITINDGQLTIYATDDGINASQKVDGTILIEVNGGAVHVTVGSGDTDAFDSNGDIYINGGTITVEARSAFDADGTAQLNGGDVTVNGQKITEISVSRGGPGGGVRGL